MRHLPVHWYEGLFIRPQHFQAADRYWHELSQTSERWDHPYSYGVVEMEFSREALANHQFQVHSLQARLRDGTLVTLGERDEPDRLPLRDAVDTDTAGAASDLSAAFEKETVVRVLLAVPKLKLGAINVSANGAGDARYVETESPYQDENRGGNDQEIQLRRLNARLLLSTDDLSGYETIPIAQVKRAGAAEATPELDEAYIPPVVSTAAWPGLGRDVVRAVFDIVGQKIDVLSEQIVNRGVGLESRTPGDLDRILMLNRLNEAYSTLSVLAFARGVHPLTAYTELCRIAGQLAIFSPERRIRDIPPYDHDNLAGIFNGIRSRIESMIFAVRDYQFEQRFFVGVGMGMQVSLEPRWFHADWQWYVGVKKGDLSAQECRDLLSPGQLDWKLGSSRQVELLFRHRAEGLLLSPVDREIRALPSGQDWVYYEVPRKDSAPWRDVQETQTLAMRLQDALILNHDRLQGERQLVVSAQNRQVSLEFALFAVPTNV